MKKILILICFLFSLLCVGTVFAQEGPGVQMSITPPLIKNNVNPGQIWRSAIKVINNNAAPINVYLETLDFKSGSENGTVEFIKQPVGEEAAEYLLSQWIVIEPGPIEIPAFSSKEVSFIIDVPEIAGPGGHYAAILAGTKPPQDNISGTNIKISSLLASLILLNVSGDVEEEGRIREFSVDKNIYYDPEVKFTIRFENLGNVHIQPQGEIKIYNFFDKERAKITINHNTEFGNILPEGIRKWEFDWAGEKSLLEMGRHRAELVLTYGTQGRETVDQIIYFWIIYPKPLIITASIAIIIILLITLLIRRYIKKSIKASQAYLAYNPPGAKIPKNNMSQTISSGKPVDLRASTEPLGKTSKFFGWKLFKAVIWILIIVIIVAAAIIIYVQYNSGDEKANIEESEKIIEADEITDEISEELESVTIIEMKDVEETATSSGIKAGKNGGLVATSTAENETGGETEEEQYVISVLNGSGVPGVANEVFELLEDNGYLVSRVGNADNFKYNSTIIKYKKGAFKAVEKISNLFSNPVEIQEVDDQVEDVVIVIGKDY